MTATLNGRSGTRRRLGWGPDPADRPAAATTSWWSRADGLLQRRGGTAPPRRPGRPAGPTCTRCRSSTAAPRWFACFDQPDLKATYSFGSPRRRTGRCSATDRASRPARGRWRIVAARPALHATSSTLVAGPVRVGADEHDGIRLGLHARASLRDRARGRRHRTCVEVTRQSFDYYHRSSAVRYPFGEYHQAFVPDFNAGAMENPGCVDVP